MLGASRIALVLALVGCGEPTYCDGAEAALASAQPGDTVTLGSCEVMGPLHVPPDVTLAGSFGSVVVAPEDTGAILAIGGDTTTVRDLSVRVEGRIGILVRGGGSVRIENVEVDVERGIGIGADGVDALAISNVVLRGTITAANATDPAFLRVIPSSLPASTCTGTCDCNPGDVRPGEACDAEGRWATIAPTHGIYAFEVGALSLTDVEVTGFALYGVVVGSSTTTYDGVAVSDTLGIGIRQFGGASTLTGVRVERTYAGLRGEPSIGLGVTHGEIDATDLVLQGNDRYGAVFTESTGRIDGLDASENDDVALWIGATTAFELTGSTLSDNGFGGLVVSESSGVHVEDTTIATTRAREYVLGAFGLVRLGDGLHVHDSVTDIRFDGVTLRNNERAGAVIDLGASGVPDVLFTDVHIEGTGASLGAVAGRADGSFNLEAESPPGWDDGIVRAGSVIANDAAFSGDIAAIDLLAPAVPAPEDTVEVVAPMF